MGRPALGSVTTGCADGDAEPRDGRQVRLEGRVTGLGKGASVHGLQIRGRPGACGDPSEAKGEPAGWLHKQS